MSALFEGSYLGDDSKLDATTKLECGICWHVYDPAEGDDVWQIAPSTPFSELPEHWKCPNCDAEKHKFMILDEEAAPKAAAPAVVAANDDRDLKAELSGLYEKAAERMRDLPVYNPKLGVAVLDPTSHDGAEVLIVVTPWFMNIVRVSDQEFGQGTKRHHAFPSGSYEFVSGELDGFGMVESCSLFSPMNDFADMDAAFEVAEAVRLELFTAPEPKPKEVDRRTFFAPGSEAP